MFSSSPTAAGRAAQVLAPAAAGLVAAWAPVAWAAAEVSDATAQAEAPEGFTAGVTAGVTPGFTPGVVASSTAPGAARRGAPERTAALAALLPDFGVHAPRAGGAAAVEASRAAIARAVAEAADAREAAVRAEYEAAWEAQAAADAERAAADAEAAYAAGLETGRAEGEAAAQAALAGAAGALDDAVAEVRAHEARWLADLEAHVAALAVAVARHVVGREVAHDDALVTELVARAVAEFPAGQPLAVRAHPADVAALKAAWAGHARAAELRWIPDAQVARGGALVEGRERIVDGRVDMALERVYRVVGGHQA